MNFQFTRADFIREWAAMRELMGSKTFWAKAPEDRDRAVKGFAFLYVNADITDDDKQTFASTMHEYTRRETMMHRMNLTQI